MNIPKIIISPSRYIQGGGELLRIPDRCRELSAKRAYLLLDGFINERYRGDILASFEGTSVTQTASVFDGECSDAEIKRHVTACDGCDVLVGIGGGKTLDTAKAAAYFAHMSVICIPTAASTDAPCSKLSVIYSESGQFDRYLFLPRNPDIVAVDTEVVSKAPVRLLCAGMGDALATYYEADACSRSGHTAMAGGNATNASLALAKLCRDLLFSEGEKAMLSAAAGICTPSLENIIEANTYLSGIGFESGGLAAAHAIHNGLTVFDECHNLLHGEKVAFGVVTQLALENRPTEEIRRVADFCKKLGLPTTLTALGLENADDASLTESARLACAPGETIHNMPFPVRPSDVVGAMRLASAICK